MGITLKISVVKQLAAVLILLAFAACTPAQEVALSDQTTTVNGKDYYLHKVTASQDIYGIAVAYGAGLEEIYLLNPASEKGIRPGDTLMLPVISAHPGYIEHKVRAKETLFKISGLYRVKVDDIMKINPGLTEAIKPGQLIRIPVPLHEKKPEKENAKFFMHVVKPGETLYGIARKYSIEIQDIKKLNPGITDNLKPGQEIKIPGEIQQVQTDSVVIYECGKSGLLPSYNIALMLPFYLEYSHEVDTGGDKSSGSTYKSLTFIQFYEGAMLAVDSLERAGVNARIYVYDIAEDTGRTAAVLAKPEMKNMNLIIGPLFSNNFAIVARWAREHQVPVVNPFTHKSEHVVNNPWVIKLSTPYDAQAAEVLRFVRENYRGANVFMVYNDREKVLPLVACYKRLADSLLTLSLPDTAFRYYEVNYTKEGQTGIAKHLSADRVNVLITQIDGEAFVNNYVRNTSSLTTRYPILVFGQRSWEGYPSVEQDYLLDLNLHVYSNCFIDYRRKEVKEFVSSFRSGYAAEPDTFAFYGYDITMYFAGALHRYGKGFIQCLNDYKTNPLCTSWRFGNLPGYGLENRSVMIHRYENYMLYNAWTEPRREIPLKEKK